MTAQEQIDTQIADSWAESVTEDLERSRRLAWFVAAALAGLCALLIIGLVILLPLKTTQPYMVMVDRQTGNVETLDPLSEQTVSVDSALTRSYLAQYVVEREGFSGPDVQADYRKVSLFSASEARQRYAAQMQSSNPASPLAFMPAGGLIDVEVRSISSLSPSRAMVRFTTTRRDPGTRASEAQYWAAVIDFAYSTGAMSQEDRLVNPLGFQVTRYRRNPETLPEIVEAQETAIEAQEAAAREVSE